MHHNEPYTDAILLSLKMSWPYKPTRPYNPGLIVPIIIQLIRIKGVKGKNADGLSFQV